MNWSGGYKNRFRITSEVRKSTFQQQNRIVLVDLVKHEIDNATEQTIHTPRNKKEELSPASSVVTDTSNNLPMLFGTPFKNIPCGTSSDSEESDKDEISNTNYSPYSSDRETSIEHEGSTSTCQSNQMVEGNHKKSDANLAVDTFENSYSRSDSSRNSFVGSTPPPYPRNDFHHSVQSLRFLTPITCSSLDLQYELEGYSESPYPRTICKDKASVQNNSFFNTSVETNSSEVPVQVSCSTPVPTDVIPAHEKGLNFYSPPQKRITENLVAAISQGNQTNVPFASMINENCEEPVVNGVIVLHKHHELRCGSHSNQTVEFATPTPAVNQSFHYPTPDLSCITPIIRRGNVVFSNRIGHQLASNDNLKLQKSSLSTRINTDSLIVPINQSETTPFRETSVFRTPRVNDNGRNQASGSLLVPIDVTPAKRKQVKFASTVPLQKMKILVPYKSTPIMGISQTETATLSQSSAYHGGRSTANSFERHALVSQSRQEENPETTTTQGQAYQDKTSTAYITKSGPTPEKVPTASSDSSPKPCVEQEKRPISATRKRQRRLALPLHTESSRGRKLNSKKSYYGRVHYCHCRTVVRKLKVRDAETQTSP